MVRTDRWTDRGRQAAELRQHVDEPKIYRINHFLGKMGHEELLFLRSANTILDAAMIGESMGFTADYGSWHGPRIES